MSNKDRWQEFKNITKARPIGETEFRDLVVELTKEDCEKASEKSKIDINYFDDALFGIERDYKLQCLYPKMFETKDLLTIEMIEDFKNNGKIQVVFSPQRKESFIRWSINNKIYEYSLGKWDNKHLEIIDLWYELISIGTNKTIGSF